MKPQAQTSASSSSITYHHIQAFKTDLKAKIMEEF